MTRSEYRRSSCQRPYAQGITMHLGDEDTPAWVNVSGVLAVLAGVAVVLGIAMGVLG